MEQVVDRSDVFGRGEKGQQRVQKVTTSQGHYIGQHVAAQFCSKNPCSYVASDSESAEQGSMSAPVSLSSCLVT